MMAFRRTSGGPLKAVLKEGVPACGSVGAELWSRQATASKRAVLAQTYLMERPIGTLHRMGARRLGVRDADAVTTTNERGRSLQI
jgi:hypothetical protein